MIKYEKLQTDVLKATIRNELHIGKKQTRYFVIKKEDNYYICDGHFIYVIPNSLFILDITKFDTLNDNIIESMNHYDNVPLELSNTTVKLPSGVECIILKQENGVNDIYIDKDLLKYADIDNLTFMGTDRKNPVTLYENDNIVGMVLPIKYW